MSLIRTLSILAVIGFAYSEDRARGYWDLRATIGSYPGVEDAKYKYDDNSPDSNDKWDTSAGSLDIFASHRFESVTAHGGFITFGLFSRGASGESKAESDVEIEHSAAGIIVGGGYSFVPTSWYSLEIGPRLGLGVSVANESGFGLKLKSDTGGYASIDFQVSNNFNVTEKFQLSANIGFAGWSSTNDYPAKDTGAGYFPGGEAEYSGSGVYFSIGAGISL